MGYKDFNCWLAPTEMPSAPSLDRTRQRKVSLKRSSSTVSIIPGVLNNSFLHTGCRMVLSSRSESGVGSDAGKAFDEKGNVAATPPRAADVRNARLLVAIRNSFISYCNRIYFHNYFFLPHHNHQL